MKCFDGRLAVFFALLLAAHSASAMEMGRCPGIGKDLEDKLWAARSTLLGQRMQAEEAAKKPSLWKSWLWDRTSWEMSYGNTSTLTLQEGGRTYDVARGSSEFKRSLTYTLPLGKVVGPSVEERQAKRDLQNFELDEQKANFYDLLYDLRLALAEKRVIEQVKDDGENKNLEGEAVAEMKVNKLAARIMNMTSNKIVFEPECIR